MKDQNNTMTRISKGFLSFFYVGYLPKAPGTFGSMATIPLIMLLAEARIGFELLIALIALLTMVSAFLAEYVQQLEQTHDPQWIVIDEVIGMLTTWAFIFPRSDWAALLLTLVLFRVFDIVKIWPASYFDKKIKHGFGTIVDDVVSGVMAGIILLAVKNYY